MKTRVKNKKDDILTEYDFSNGIRGKHYKKFQDGFTVTVYSPNKETYLLNKKEKINYIKIDKDISKYFRTSDEINNALRAILSAIPKKQKLAV
jgi:hypothetical protein